MNCSREDIIAQYEDLLIGKRKKLLIYGAPAECDEAARIIFRYAVKNLLKMTETEALEHMTPEILSMLKLDEICERFMQLPADMDIRVDPDYLVSVVFRLPYDSDNQIRRQYDRIMKGELSRFSPNTFVGTNGPRKASVLLRDFIHREMYVATKEELYARFAAPDIVRKLTNAGLKGAYTGLYNTPLEYLHYSLSPQEQDDYLFSAYSMIRLARFVENEAM